MAMRQSRAFRDGACLRCKVAIKLRAKRVFCERCLEALKAEAFAWQERDYLAAYLSTREDEVTPQVKRLRALAAAQGVKWKTPPAMLLFADRLAYLMLPYRAQAIA